MTTLKELADEFGVSTDELRDFTAMTLHLEDDLEADIRHQWANREQQADDETAEGLAAAADQSEDAAKVTVHTQDGEPVRPMYGQEGYDPDQHATRV